MNRSSSLSSSHGAYLNWWAEISGHLGGVYPFYDTKVPGHYSLDVGEMIRRRKEHGLAVELDLMAVACKAHFPHLLGDRTLLQDICRAPWMATLQSRNDWEPVELPPHGRSRPDPEAFTSRFKEALVNELASYVKDRETVGILLSGGMDSRIVAGVLRELQQRQGTPKNVVALTWGDTVSRDVIYSTRIAQIFDWEMVHFPITAETLRRNFDVSAQIGAEVSPLHLHAMPDVAMLEGLDLVIAGSYGDSVGRAEFSGRRLENLKPILAGGFGRYGVLRSPVRKAMMSCLRSDISDHPFLRNATDAIRRNEIEQEAYYMRRMLQSCMLIIAERTPLYQLFTSPSVFGLMWGVDPSVRDDTWYARLLPLLPGNLIEIPWARTGRRYDLESGAADDYSKHYHAYGYWLRTELRDLIIERVNSDSIRGLGVFNDQALDNVLKAWNRGATRTTNSLDELTSWLACLFGFINRHGIATTSQGIDPKASDSLRAFVGGLRAELYIAARNQLRE